MQPHFMEVACLYSDEVTRIFSSWNVTVRNVYNIPWTTHRYLIEGVSNSVHPKTMMCSRLVKFLECLKSCSKGSVRYLVNLVYNDRRTLTGRTVTKIARDCDVERSTLCSSIAKSLVYRAPPLEEEWRLPLLKELLDVRSGHGQIPGVVLDEVNVMINNICSS